MQSMLRRTMIKKKKNPFSDSGYVRELFFGTKKEDEVKLRQSVFPPQKGVGKIEITHENVIIASLTFQFGKNLAKKPIEVRANDIYLDAGHLDAIRVGEKYRGGKLASQMLAELIHYAKTKKTGTIYLRVNVANTDAVNLYKKFGFKVVRTIGDNEHLMACFLG